MYESDYESGSTGYFDNTGDNGYQQAAQDNIAVDGGRVSAQTYAPRQEWTTNAGHAVQSEKKKEKGHVFRKVMLSMSMGLLFGIFAGAGFLGVTQATNALQKSTPAASSETTILPKLDTKVEELPSTVANPKEEEVLYVASPASVTEIVKEVMPAMVSITNNYTEVTTFWGQRYKEDLSASGSGIIVAKNDTELLIVTNNHVVADANELIVTLDDGTDVQAKIKGKDADMDLAVIAINIDDLSAETLNAIEVAELGDSDELELGEQVIAIGNALGYGQSVTVGYISALDREIELEDGSTKSFIQTDAAINPGNSGGALLNSEGEVIGINSNKIGGSSIEGMGYAIPITAASPIIADLMERQTRNKVADGETGYIGISYQDVTDDIAKMFGMPKGVYVAAVYEGTGAEAAGIMKGDVITKFDGERITSFEDLQDVLQYFGEGDTVRVTIMRPSNGEYQEREVELTLGKRPTRNR